MINISKNYILNINIIKKSERCKRNAILLKIKQTKFNTLLNSNLVINKLNQMIYYSKPNIEELIISPFIIYG